VQAADFDQSVGIHVFTTKTAGVGGRIRCQPEDFVVQEIDPDGGVAPLEPVNVVYPDQPGKFVAFFLVKRNIDTLQAIRQLSRILGVSYKRFSYAGIKDSRAVTSQRVSLRDASPHDFLGRDTPILKMLHPHRVSKPIVPGSLQGNRFSIIIRDIEVTRPEAVERVTRTKAEFEQLGGILNFFGHQRFGMPHPNTHLIGKQILEGDLKKAVYVLLDKANLESPEVDEGEAEAPTEDTLSEPLRYLHPQQSYERAISQYLAKHPADYAGSLRVLPKDLLRLYIHAYQALLFNEMLSERVKRGMPLVEPTVGDFIMPATGEIHGVRMVTEATLAKSQEEVRRGRQKLVLPLVGYDFAQIDFQGQMGEIVTKVLRKVRVAPGQFRVAQLPVLSSRGSFRPVLAQPRGFEFSVVEADGPVYVKLVFTLPKSSYATVVLREFVKPRFIEQLS
jgi:tRNA pseudouridine13 synthase